MDLRGGAFFAAAASSIAVLAEGLYWVRTKTAMYWLYDGNALLIGDHDYEMEPPTVVVVSQGDCVDPEDLARLVEPYVPHTKESARATPSATSPDPFYPAMAQGGRRPPPVPRARRE